MVPPPPTAAFMRLRVAQPRGGVAAGACVLLLTGLVAACGTPNPKIVDAREKARVAPATKEGQALAEADKIRALISAVRSSDHTFIQNGTEREGAAAAADLERRLARVPAGLPTARLFIDRVGAGRLRADEPDQVRTADGTTVPTRSWFLARLAELEGKPLPAGQRPSDGKNSGKAAKLGILDALTIVERSGLRFVAPARRSASGKLKGKRKEYAAGEFSEMLRKKWEFLGADIDDLDGFIQEIATDAFASMEPYRVMHTDGSEEEFRGWLLAELEARRHALAQGGAP